MSVNQSNESSIHSPRFERSSSINYPIVVCVLLHGLEYAGDSIGIRPQPAIRSPGRKKITYNNKTADNGKTSKKQHFFEMKW